MLRIHEVLNSYQAYTCKKHITTNKRKRKCNIKKSITSIAIIPGPFTVFFYCRLQQDIDQIILNNEDNMLRFTTSSQMTI